MNQTFSLLIWSLQNPKTRKRLAISFLICLCVGALNTISLLPLVSWYKKLSFGFDTESSFPAGINFSIFIFGITAFLSACFILQVGSAFIHVLRRWTFGTAKARKNLLSATLSLTFGMTALQAYLVGVSLAEVTGIASGNRLFICLFILITTLAVGFLLLMAYLIQRYGVGNGIALVSVSLNIHAIIGGIFDLFNNSDNLTKSSIIFILVIGLFTTAFYLARKTWLADFNLDDKTTVHLPFRVTIVGHVPKNMATAILLIPSTILAFSSSTTVQWLSDTLSSGWLHGLALLFFITIFAFLYTLLVFKPKRLQDLMTHFGYLKSLLDENYFSHFLDRYMSKLLLITVGFIFAATILPQLAIHFLSLPPSGVYLLLGWFIVVLGGVVADLISQIEFYQKQHNTAILDWKIIDVSGDELEATLKAGYLSSQNIVALIEPLRFSWGVPIRTIVDSYKIYVPTINCEKAASLLTNPKNH